jgi:hypothetical protein
MLSTQDDSDTSVQAIIRPRTSFEARKDLEPHHGFEEHCSQCQGTGWYPTLGNTSNWCDCFYKLPGDVQ